MRFLNSEDACRELALEDVFLCQGHWTGNSRRDVNITPIDGLPGSNPIVAANMNAVAGKRLAEALARAGGIAILPQDMSVETVTRAIRKVCSAHPIFETPLTVGPNQDARLVMDLVNRRGCRLVIVVDDQRKPLGVVTPDDLWDDKFREKLDPFAKAHAFMTAPFAIRPDSSLQYMFEQLFAARVSVAPVVDSSGVLIGTVSRDLLVHRALNPWQTSDMAVGAAVGINGESVKKAVACVEAGASVIVLDTAHGDQVKMLKALREVRAAVDPGVKLVAGNVCMPDGVKRLIEAGADIVKTNVGPGAMCTTRLQTGVGRPSFSTTVACALAAKDVGGFIWADGGVKHPRDLGLYLAAGASRVMIGTSLAGTYEAPGELKRDPDGAAYKVNFGMASRRAVVDRNAGIGEFEAAIRAMYEEGISNSKVFLREGQDTVGRFVAAYITGLQSSMTYVGARTLPEFCVEAIVGVQTSAAFHEGTPHGAIRK